MAGAQDRRQGIALAHLRSGLRKLDLVDLSETAGDESIDADAPDAAGVELGPTVAGVEEEAWRKLGHFSRLLRFARRGRHEGLDVLHQQVEEQQSHDREENSDRHHGVTSSAASRPGRAD